MPTIDVGSYGRVVPFGVTNRERAERSRHLECAPVSEQQGLWSQAWGRGIPQTRSGSLRHGLFRREDAVEASDS